MTSWNWLALRLFRGLSLRPTINNKQSLHDIYYIFFTKFRSIQTPESLFVVRHLFVRIFLVDALLLIFPFLIGLDFLGPPPIFKNRIFLGNINSAYFLQSLGSWLPWSWLSSSLFSWILSRFFSWTHSRLFSWISIFLDFQNKFWSFVSD